MLHRTFVLGLFLLLISSAVSQAVIAQTTPGTQNSQTADEEMKKAQAEYYRVQTERLRGQPFLKNLAENPAGVMTTLAAFVAGFIALLSLIVNRGVTIRTQKDTQFYEALKRFGDQESAMLRASAAGLISQIGKERSSLLRRKPYFHTATDQLITGLLLESDSVTLLSISDAVRNISGRGRVWTVSKLRAANDKLHEDLEEQIIQWAIANHVTTLTAFTDLHVQQLTAISEPAGLVVSEWLQSYGDLAPDSQREVLKTYESRFLSAQATTKVGDPESLASLQRRIAETSNRLQFLNGLLVDVITAPMARFQKRPRVSLSAKISKKTRRFMGVFLQGMDLYGQSLTNVLLIQALLQKASFVMAQLEEIDFRFARLQQADFTLATMRDIDLSHSDLVEARMRHATLTNVNLREANLRSADLAYVEFTNVRIAGAKIDENTNFEGADWWQCDFHTGEEGANSKNVDSQLIQELIIRRPLPTWAGTKVHESVSSYRKEQAQLAGTQDARPDTTGTASG